MPIAVTSSGASTNLPLTLTEAKAHLLVDYIDQDTLITSLIKAVGTHTEGYLGRSLINKQYQWTMDSFPAACNLYFPKPPLVSVDSISYLASSDGASTSWGSTYYNVDSVSQPARLEPAYNEMWPGNVRAQNNAVTLKFTAGYGTYSSDVPEDIRTGMKLMIGHLFENRQNVVVGTGYQIELIQGSEFFLAPYRMPFFEGY
jgi:uncharacterized phiE125 gp8 family phage protein